jgi:SAM-dependent methyltransferase
MNFLHHWLCRSERWRRTAAQRVSWALAGRDLGPSVLELGPGPGLTTDFLCHSVPNLTALELDKTLADSLRWRLHGSDVDVVAGDATCMPFPDEQFSAVVSFTMLHHVPSRELQNRLFSEVFRVLKPGGTFAGSDSLDGWLMRLIHIGDTLVPVDPATFGTRLTAIGFEGVLVERNPEAFRFCARRHQSKPLQLATFSEEVPHLPRLSL